MRVIAEVTLIREPTLQVVDKLPTGEPVVIGLILRRYVVSHLLVFLLSRQCLAFFLHGQTASHMMHYLHFVFFE